MPAGAADCDGRVPVAGGAGRTVYARPERAGAGGDLQAGRRIKAQLPAEPSAGRGVSAGRWVGGVVGAAAEQVCSADEGGGCAGAVGRRLAGIQG